MTHPKPKRKGARTLHLGAEVWTYFIGKKFVEIASPDNTKVVVPRAQLDQAVPGRWPEDGETDITLPGAVANYINSNLRSA